MIDITQSYNIFDSNLFKESKIIEELVEENPNYCLIESANSKVLEKANKALDDMANKFKKMNTAKKNVLDANSPVKANKMKWG